MSTTSSKQKTLHPALAISINNLLSVLVWISCIAPFSNAVATPKIVQPQGDQVASLRLLAMPGLTKGRYVAGIEIAMPPGSHTYWKQPGEAGVPPVFAFNGSVNVERTEVQYPTPSRISEAGIEAFGYADRVIFPVEVTPIAKDKPAELKLVADYAVCNKICIPAHGSATLSLTPNGAGTNGPAVQAALATVPTPIPAADRADLSVRPNPRETKPSWTIAWSGKAPIDDIFADAPEGFYFETRKRGADQFVLTAVQTVSSDKTTRVPVSLTLARKTGSLVAEQTLEIFRSTN